MANVKAVMECSGDVFCPKSIVYNRCLYFIHYARKARHFKRSRPDINFLSKTNFSLVRID